MDYQPFCKEVRQACEHVRRAQSGQSVKSAEA